ncbi:hypothetical protein [Cerasicoccus fimbriatus]|uniref:hypothetical protein n=1 Tax=Cerasicoccus fimbriatus TaxID=3014554 RepID=UPI0022B4E6AC|nr:hypothetical protein [Cerasicoccus sp. TK19100]
MPRRSAGDPLPLWIKILALLVPICLAGGYIAYQHQKQEMRELASSKNLRLVGGAQQYILEPSSEVDSLAFGAGKSLGNIGGQGSDYQEQILSLSSQQNTLPQLDSEQSIKADTSSQLMHSSKSLLLVEPGQPSLFSSSKSGMVFPAVVTPEPEETEEEEGDKEALAE